MRGTPQVGWVGLGRMGSKMVGRLLDAGNKVVVCDSNKVCAACALCPVC
jgi:3-hydroxyisobutyrate dehydrogenase-like beta-hydroxyacid dehydrogenase